jgi:hypothetical protein
MIRKDLKRLTFQQCRHAIPPPLIAPKANTVNLKTASMGPFMFFHQWMLGSFANASYMFSFRCTLFSLTEQMSHQQKSMERKRKHTFTKKRATMAHLNGRRLLVHG